MSNRLTLLFTAAIAACCPPVLAADAGAEPALAIPANDPALTWAACPAFIPAGCEIAVLHGDPGQPNADIYFRVPGNFAIPHHWHTSPERMVLVAGRMQVRYDGQAPILLQPGMYAYGPARRPHDAYCLAGSPCVLFIAFEGPVDAVETEAGQPPFELGEAANGAEARLQALGIALPEAPPPVANYVNAVRSGSLVFLAGKGPNRPEGGYVTGQVGTELTVEQGYEAARLTGIAQLAALRAELGSLDRVTRIVKVLGMVNAAPGFTQQPEVINGYSDLMVEVFGDRGKHARAAVGMASLPRNIAVEVEMIVEVTD